MTRRFATATVRLERLTSQQLAGPGGDSAEDVVGRILAVQAQDDRGCRLAIRSRTRGLSVQDVDDALNDRRLVVTWLNRGTLHLVRTEDYWWLHPLTAPRTASALSHRLRQLGVSDGQARRAVDVIVETLKAEGPLARRDLKDRLDLPRSLTDGQTLVYLLGTASHRGLIVRGPMRGSDHAFVSVEAWLGHPPPAAEHTDGLGRLARRYLQGHGPAGPADLAKWAGITLGHARLGFSVLADRIRPPGRTLSFGDGPPAFPSSRRAGCSDPSIPFSTDGHPGKCGSVRTGRWSRPTESSGPPCSHPAGSREHGGSRRRGSGSSFWKALTRRRVGIWSGTAWTCSAS